MNRNELKSINKSIRVSESVFEFVNGLPGNGFNEKFSDMVYLYSSEEEDLKGRISILEQTIEQLQTTMFELDKQVVKRKRLLAVLDSIGNELERITKTVVEL